MTTSKFSFCPSNKARSRISYESQDRLLDLGNFAKVEGGVVLLASVADILTSVFFL